jgi:hypothetical protein
MRRPVDSEEQVKKLCEELLVRADAAGRWPTPVADIVAAADLEEPEDSPLSESILQSAPRHLRKAVALIKSQKIRALLDRRERTIQVDPSIGSDGRERFLRLHEVTHDLCPWQKALAYADDDLTLSPSAKQIFERQANFGGAELLFQGHRFKELANSYAIGMGAVGDLATTVGASLRATLRAFAEAHDGAVCGLVLKPSPISTSPLRYARREVTQSDGWVARFGSFWPRVLGVEGFQFLEAISREGLLDFEDPKFSFPDRNLEPVEIKVDVIVNRFDVLLLLWIPRRETFKRKRKLLVEGSR